MANPLLAYRVYASRCCAFESLKNVSLTNGIQVVLAFARDYDSNKQHKAGVFQSYFHPEVTPQAISEFKKSNSKNKTFLGIGGRHWESRFSVHPNGKSAWIQNAVDSLSKIIKDYKFDGIDVYYEHIDPNCDADLFGNAISEVTMELKRKGAITQASLTVPAHLSATYYSPMLKNHQPFDTVVYQSHTEVNSAPSGLNLVKNIKQLGCPKEKIFAGHSVLPTDWSNVPSPLFIGAIPELLNKRLISGISHWSVTSDHDPEK